MAVITDIAPDILKEHHGLSSQQINSIFGRTVTEEIFEEKTAALDRVAEFLRVTDAFSAAGIKYLPLKGPILSFRLYGDATLRQYSDLDILIEVAGVEQSGSHS